MRQPSAERESSLWQLFLNLWSRDVGTEGYDKEKWKRLEALILAAISQRNDLEDWIDEMKKQGFILSANPN